MILGPKCEISRPNKYTDWSKQVDWGMGFCPPNRLRLKWIAPNKHWELDIWYGFPKMGDSNMWISRGITTPLRWDDGTWDFPQTMGFLHFSYGFPMVFLWFSDVFPMFFKPHISPGISRDLRTLPHLVLRRLAKGHQLATADQEARQDDQHATWKDGKLT